MPSRIENVIFNKAFDLISRTQKKSWRECHPTNLKLQKLLTRVKNALDCYVDSDSDPEESFAPSYKDQFFVFGNVRDTDDDDDVHCNCCGRQWGSYLVYMAPAPNSSSNSLNYFTATNKSSTQVQENGQEYKKIVEELMDILQTFRCFQFHYDILDEFFGKLVAAILNSRGGKYLEHVLAQSYSFLEPHCSCCSKKQNLNPPEPDGPFNPIELADKICGEMGENNMVANELKVNSDSDLDTVSSHASSSGDETVTESSTDTEGISSINHALGIDAILEEIMRCATPDTLVACRSVNSMWSKISTEVLLKKKALSTKVYFGPYNESKTDLIQPFLTVFNATMDSGRQFPSNNFCFFGRPLHQKTLQTFLTEYGHLIKGMTMDFGTTGVSWVTSVLPGDLVHLLACQLPNLESFTLHNHPRASPNENENITFGVDYKGGFSSLKYFTVDTSIPTKLFQIVLTLAKYLQEVNVDIDSAPPVSNSIVLKNRTVYLTENIERVMPSLVYFDKVYLLRRIRLDFEHDCTSQEYKHLLFSTAPLRKLIIEDIQEVDDLKDTLWPTISNDLYSIFMRSCSSLRELRTGPLGFIPDLEFPTLPKLHTLTISGFLESTVDLNKAHWLSEIYLPPGYIFSEVFPNLRCIIMETCFEHNVYYPWDRDRDQTSAGSGSQEMTADIIETDRIWDVLFTVTDISFKQIPPLPWLRNCTRMFPCVTSLTVQEQASFSDTKGVLDILSDFTELKNFVLGIRTNHRYTICNYGAIDSFLTGFSQKACRRIFETWTERELPPSTYDKLLPLRVHKSLADLKNLQYFELKFIPFYGCMNDDLAAVPRYHYPLVSRVSGAFAFKTCPQLEVAIELDNVDILDDYGSRSFHDMFERLKTVFPYVQAVHFPEKFNRKIT